MSSEADQMDAMVDAITRRVAERLALGAAPSGDPGHDPSTPCDATADTCNGCGFCATRKESTVDRLIQLGATRVGAGPGGNRPKENIASVIDHTLLKADATYDDLKTICDEARKWQFATVCVNAANIPLVAKMLDGSGVKPIAVVGFPLGASTPSAKGFEAREAVRSGAREIDMVINIGALKSRDYALVSDDICKVVAASKPYPVKVILETGGLTEDEKIVGCALSKASGAAFVKTSTGFGPGGATIADVALMRRIVGDDMQVKASGGVRSAEDVKAMVAAGADRVGASASVAIVSGKKSTSAY
jgi:deoxyribose-phosphate aldolase